ncbi:MAG: Maf family protein [Planctomycetota bacterium]|nr:Maf family protein [Planctomycetota bacterium]MCX8039328.1 Maf family protein [Planctomycetota bacterium]MDW8372094.1 Maf family protein [Planctomycetota bacterium]
MLYLASRSPQRARLLAAAGVPFTVVATACSEETVSAPLPSVLALERARCKARSARDVPPGAIVLGADTVVALGNAVLGNPGDAAEVAAMLRRLSGTTHQVFTAHCLCCAGSDREARAVTMARVTMRPLTEEEIAAYAASGEGIGKAGGYAIQERGDRFIVDLQGAPETVIGLHVPTVAKLWRELTDTALPGYRGSSPSGPLRAVRP